MINKLFILLIGIVFVGCGKVFAQNQTIKIPYNEFYPKLEITDTTIQTEYFTPTQLKSKTIYYECKSTINGTTYTGSFAVRKEKYYKNGVLKFLRLSPDILIKTEVYYNEQGKKHKEYFYSYPSDNVVKIKSNAFYTLWSKDWTYNKYEDGVLISTEYWKNRRKVKEK